MSTEIYKSNLDIVKRMSSELYRIITEESPIYDIDIEDAFEGNNYILKSRGVSAYVHSLYDIEHEMEMTCKNLDGSEKTVVVFGVGCGYIFEHLKKNYKNIERIIVIEPTLQTFIKFLEVNDLKKSTLDLSIIYLVNRNVDFASKVIAQYHEKNKDIKFVFNLAYYMSFPGYYKKILTDTMDTMLKFRNNVNVTVGLLNLWLINGFSNWNYCNRSLSLLKQYFKGKTVVIVGAGPSLDKNIHLIEELKNKAIVIAIGSAIKILDSRGIIPHFRMAYDGSPNEMQAFDGIDTSAAPIIFSPKLFYKALLNYKGMKIHMSLDRDYMNRYVDKKRGIENADITISGSSILICAVNLSINFGCNRIVLMGIDMGSKGDRLYAPGLGADKEKTEVDSSKYMAGEDIYGEAINIHKGLYTALLDLEKMIKNNPEIPFIDATEGGVFKKGTRVMKLKEVMDEYLYDDMQIKNIVQDVEKQYNEIQDLKSEITESIADIYEEINRVEFILDKYMNNAKKIRNDLYKGYDFNKVEKEIQGLNNFTMQLEEIDLYNLWVSKELRFIYTAIEYIYTYKGKDKKVKYENEIKRHLSYIAEINNYIISLKALSSSLDKGTLREELLNS